jgi:hypothetical protein
MSAEERDFLDEFDDQREPEEAVDESDTPEVETADVAPPAKAEPEAPAAPEPHQETSVPYAAMKAEREKRQERERELQERDKRIAEYERQLEELRNPTQKQEQPDPVEIWENPDAFVSQRIQTVEQRATNRLYAALEAQARELYPDYDEIFSVVQEHAKTNPMVGQQVLSAPNPALAAYKLGKQLREAKQLEDPVAYREKLAAEIRAEIEAEFKAKEEAKRKAVNAIPPDLSSSRNVAGKGQPVSEDPFETLFPRN